MLNVLCIHHPSAVFTHLYVNTLYSMVKRHLTVPYIFHVVTTDAEQKYSHGIHVIPWTFFDHRVPEPEPHNYAMWMGMEMFKPGRFQGPCLYLDQDIFIIGNIDFLAGYSGTFMALDYRMLPGMLNASIMAWTPGEVSDDIYEHLLEPQVWAKRKRYRFFGQQLISERLKERGVIADHVQCLFPGKAISYRIEHLQGHMSLRGVSIVYCHGKPKPHQINNQELRRHWR